MFNSVAKETKEDLSNAPQWSPHPEQMANVVQNALQYVSKRYSDDKKRCPLKSHKKRILKYFKRKQIDGARFLVMTKPRLIRDLKQYILGTVDENKKMEEAFGLLFVYIQWQHALPRKRHSIINRRAMLPKQKSSPIPQSSAHAPREPLTILNEGIGSMHPPDIKLKCSQCGATKPKGIADICGDCSNKPPSSVRFNMSTKHKRAATGGERNKNSFPEKILKAPKLTGLRGIRGKSVSDKEERVVWADPYGFKSGMSADIEFEWKETSNPLFLDCEHFIYVVSIIIDALNSEYRCNEHESKLLFNKSLILSYLYAIRMDGLLFKFNGSGCEQEFVQNIKHIVFDTGVKDSDFLTERVKQEYAQQLYQRIISVNLHSIDVVPLSKCKISFNPSVCSVMDDDLKKYGVSLLSTLNQCQDIYRSHLTKPKEKRKIEKTLNECNDKINAVLCNKWAVYMKNEVKIWDHNIQSMQQCQVLNMLYVLDCILINKKFRGTLHHRDKLNLERYAPKIIQYFETYAISGEKFQSWNRLQKLLSDFLDPSGRMTVDLDDHLSALLRIIRDLNVFRITAFHIKTDVKWNESIQSLIQCTEKDMIYIVLYLLSEDDTLAKLTPFEPQIVEYFVKHHINGSVFDHMKEQQFVNHLDKFIKFKSKSPLVKLFYGVKRCRMRDIANISVQEDEKHSTHSKRGAFTKWDKRTTFKDIKRVGYKWKDGVIVTADIVSPFNEENKNKLRIHVLNIGNQETEPFWLTLPNSKLCKPTMESIEASHYAVFNKWIMILRIKNMEHSEFEDNIFHPMAIISERHPQLLFTIRRGNYAVKLEHKTYDRLLESFFAFSLRSKCRMSRCHHKPKLDCHCNANEFQQYTYYMMMAIMTQQYLQQESYITQCRKDIERHLSEMDKSNRYRVFKRRKKGTKVNLRNAAALSYIIMEYAIYAEDSMLQILKTEHKNTERLSRALGSFLPQDLQNNRYLNEYYIHHIQQWLLHDFYNILCSHCGSVNKSIMINRVFRYSATLRNCRTCGVIVRARHALKSHETCALSPMNTDIMNWFIGQNRKILAEQKVDAIYLEKALNGCTFDDDTHQENDILNALELNERFDELTYYLSRFLDDITPWKEWRVKITANYYFYEKDASMIAIDQLMADAGIHTHHRNIFKDCWIRALFNKQLIEILHGAHHDKYLCIDLECLQILRTITPSIATFTAQFIQDLQERVPKIRETLDLFGLIKRFSDFKVDHNVFPYLKQVEILSLLWDDWVYLESITIPAHAKELNVYYNDPEYDSLRNELIKEVRITDHQYTVLFEEAERIWKANKKKKKSKSKTKISIAHIHSVLLFVAIPEIRHKINALLTNISITEIYSRFGHLFRLLFETIHSYGGILPLNPANPDVWYYDIDETLPFDKYRANMNVPLLTSNRPGSFQKNSANKRMAELRISAPIHYFNISSIVNSECLSSEQQFYICFGGVNLFEIEETIHLNRQQLMVGSSCRVWAEGQRRLLRGKIVNIRPDGQDEWLRVQLYKDRTKDVERCRLSDDLSVTMPDHWYFDAKHQSQSEPQKDSFLMKLIGPHPNILTKYGIQCNARTILRIKTIITYYKKQHIIPDFDVFVQETDFNEFKQLTDDTFRSQYLYERQRTQNKQKQNIKKSLKTVDSKSKQKDDDCKDAGNTPTKVILTDKLYEVGLFMRYEVANPRFESLSEEIMFNEEANISNERFNQHLVKAKEIFSQNFLIMLSIADDFNFGIEKYQSLCISHIISIIIYTEESEYSRAFTRSCLLFENTDSEIVMQNHCNNFYWFGRYIFESIEYFGKTLNEQSGIQQRHSNVQGLPQTFKFDLFAPPINFPKPTTKSLDMGLHYAADAGCVLEFVPKYNGVLNSTKFIDLSTLSDDYDADMRLFFGKGCAIQIKDIVLSNHGNHNSLRNFILPLLYFEKIMLQTVFDRQFFNAEHLYDKEGHGYKSDIQYTLFNLIQSCVGIALIQRIQKDMDENIQLIMINKYFPLKRTGKNEILYVINLLRHWCSKRTFITFEAFAAELPFMVPKLRDFFVTKSQTNGNGSYEILIDNLLRIMPNLQNYRNFEKQVVNVERSSFEKLQNSTLRDDTGIIDTINGSLHDYYGANSAPYTDGKFRKWCKNQNFNDTYIEEQMKASFESFDKTVLQFDRDFPFPVDTVQSNSDKSRQVWQILRYATKPDLLKLLYGTSDDFDLSTRNKKNELRRAPYGTYKRSRVLAPRLSVSRTPGFQQDTPDDYNAIYHALSNCQQHEIPDEICDILEKLEYFNDEFIVKEQKKSFPHDSFKRRISEETDHLKIATALRLLSRKKEAIRTWKNRNRPLLIKFYGPISKLHKADKQDFVKIAEEIGIFDECTMHKLCEKLMRRLFTDIERMKPWKCRTCWFMNRKMMIGGLWCLYNQLNECGLCGEERHKIKKAHMHPEDRKRNTRSKEPRENAFKLPSDLTSQWKQVQDMTDDERSCSIKHGTDEQVYLERWTVKLMKKYVIKYVNEVNDLKSKKRIIIHYFDEHGMNGSRFLSTSKKEFLVGVGAAVGNQKLTKHLSKLQAKIMKHINKFTVICKPMKRIAIILDQYQSWTKQLHETNHRYPYPIRQFLSALSDMSKVTRAQLVDDVEHMMRHTPAMRNKQPYVRKTCKSDARCIHQNRIRKHGDIHLTMTQKYNLFNCDDWKDFVYILYLDKIHCALFHDSKGLNISFSNDNEKDIIRRYSTFAVYSTGVYIDHSSLSSLHVNLKCELIHNTVYDMTETQFHQSVQRSKDIRKQKLKEVNKWKAKESNEIYGIKIGDAIQIEHILVVYLYTSNTTLCTKFRESYRSNARYHINHFYWMGRFIYAAIQFFGEKPQETDRFYHGLKKHFLFTEFSTIFEIPTSTTTTKHIARNRFSGDSGIVLTLGPKFKNELNNNKYLNVSSISNYREDERLFAGMTVLAVINIEYRRDGKCKSLGKNAEVLLYFERIVEQTIHNRNYYNYAVNVSKEEQRNRLLPLIDHQIRRNSKNEWDLCLELERSESKDEYNESACLEREKDEYLYALFEHFCDSKRDYINLTCINDEIDTMDELIQNIFFKPNKGNEVNKLEINDEKLQFIFPKLKGYKNHLGYWIHFDTL